MPSSPAIVQVVLDRPLRTPLDYLPPAGRNAADVPAGARVRVPVGRALAIGMVVGHAGQSALDVARLKPVSEVLDAEPLLLPPLLELLRWTADYYHHPPGEVLLSALPAPLREGASALPLVEHLQLTPAGGAALAADEARRAPRQLALLQTLARAAGPVSAGDLQQMWPDWRHVARALRARGWVELRQLSDEAAPVAGTLPAPGGAVPSLTMEQAAAVAAIDAAAGRFECLLLQGATGSGKTEVYLRAVASTLQRHQDALVLVPEIGLTPQLVERFRARFAAPIAVMHSGLSDGERLAAWRETWRGRARIVIGTRSAVFAPLARLGLIIVDEEHDSSFKQQDGGCRYSARDLAVRRAQQGGIPIVLGSATPALETLHNVAQRRYQRLLLPRRADQAAAPTLSLIDLRSQPMQGGLSQFAIEAMRRHLDSDGQVLVFINRRGYAPTLLCTACGWIAPCHACDARMTVHRGADRLRCHYCGADEPLPQRCARCGFAVKPVGQGTERMEETVRALFPDQALARLDRDTARRPADAAAVMQSMLDGRARILIGTQMVAKGHHFPEITLAVVLNADQGLFSGDFRAPERLAQTIIQVAGRAGRADRAGEVLLQSEYPEHPLLQGLLTGGYEAFAADALKERAAAHWPPFSRIALLRASASQRAHVIDFLDAARRSAGQSARLRLQGPVDAAMARRAGRHHAHLLIESAERGVLQRFLQHWVPQLEALPAARRVRWALDVDPLDTQ